MIIPSNSWGKLLVQSLEWLFHNFRETHHFTDHAKNNRENPFCNMQTLWQQNMNRIQNRALTLEAAMHVQQKAVR